MLELKGLEDFIKEVRVNNFPESLKIGNFPSELKISNFPEQKEIEIPEYPTSVKINNFDELVEKMPRVKEVEVKEPRWYKGFVLKDLTDKLGELFIQVIEKISNITFRVDLSKHYNPDKAIAVKIFNSKGRIVNEFGGAAIIGSSGGGDGSIEILKKTAALTASGIVHTPASGKKIRIYNLKFSLSADMTDIAFKFGAGGVFEKFLAPKTGGLYGTNLHPNYNEGNAGQPLNCDITGTGTVQINLDYQEI